MNRTNYSEPSKASLYMQQALRPIRKKYMYSPYVNRLPISPDFKVMEFGSGIGVMAELLARKLHDGQLTCVDISDRYLSRARKNLREYPNIDFYNGRLVNLDLCPGEFDAINIHNVLHDILKENRESLLEEMYDLLCPDGKVYLREPIKEKHGISIEEINDLFSNAGFYPVYEEKRKNRFTGDYYVACFSKISIMKFFFA